jgi:hypothetical protein
VARVARGTDAPPKGGSLRHGVNAREFGELDEPAAGLIEVKGTLYGTTGGGGSYSCGYGHHCGTVFSGRKGWRIAPHARARWGGYPVTNESLNWVDPESDIISAFECGPDEGLSLNPELVYQARTLSRGDPTCVPCVPLMAKR